MPTPSDGGDVDANRSLSIFGVVLILASLALAAWLVTSGVAFITVVEVLLFVVVGAALVVMGGVPKVRS